MIEGLVSVITPCYNGETYLENYFKSILSQTYSKVEVIFINDGSSDNTEKIVKEYESKIKNKGYVFKYIYQENSGQATALNKGLKVFNGEFLTWPDADDIMHKDSIEKRVKFLEQHKEYGFVRNSVNVVDYETGRIKGKFILNKKNANENIFEDLIFEKNIFFAPVSYMVRTSIFKEAIPDKKIYESRYGQNWQMLLPISYISRCGYIEDTLCDYIVRKNSHSRSNINSFKKVKLKAKGHMDILKNTLLYIGVFEKYKFKIYEKYARVILKEAYLFQNRKEAIVQFSKIKKYGKIKVKDYLYLLGAKYKILNKIIKILLDIRKITRLITR